MTRGACAALLALVPVLAACGADRAPDSADCTRVSSLWSSGQPLAQLNHETPPPIPDTVTDVHATVLPPEPGITEIPAGESTLARPDAEVPTLVAIGRMSGAVSTTKSEFEQILAERDWRAGSGSESKSGGELRRFSQAYEGQDVTGSVVVLDCGEPWYLVSQR
ncbi:hypothetical protein SAMN05216266_13512 [Amycolatopsis marina]|uniref:Lipoprotein n=1 Tax=Amycolatopsis marina TaxID=490629 RepID=A0A1I1CLP0_9PSEU|nr:hypothetical protein [Amycolatopsis marina]SFB63444.1 hypothetical protein SAMN05216266_13512 [Amycolatopsis marina]